MSTCSEGVWVRALEEKDAQRELMVSLEVQLFNNTYDVDTLRHEVCVLGQLKSNIIIDIYDIVVITGRLSLANCVWSRQRLKELEEEVFDIDSSIDELQEVIAIKISHGQKIEAQIESLDGILL